MYLSFRGIDFFAFWVMELFRQFGIICFACQICLNCSNSVFFPLYQFVLYFLWLSRYLCIYLDNCILFKFFIPFCGVRVRFSVRIYSHLFCRVHVLFVICFVLLIHCCYWSSFAQSSIFCVVHHCCSFCPCFFNHCIACRSTVYASNDFLGIFKLYL